MVQLFSQSPSSLDSHPPHTDGEKQKLSLTRVARRRDFKN